MSDNDNLIICPACNVILGKCDSEWVPVNERLPEPGQIVIGWHAYAKKAIQYTFTVDAIYTAPGHFVDGDCCFCEDITHWMELHEPPTPLLFEVSA